MNEYVAAIVPTLGAVAACVAAAAAWRNSKRNGAVLQQQNDAIQEVHVLVNSRLSDVLARVDQLTQILESEDISVPPEPSMDGSKAPDLV